jgi:hypothetical protein
MFDVIPTVVADIMHLSISKWGTVQVHVPLYTAKNA